MIAFKLLLLVWASIALAKWEPRVTSTKSSLSFTLQVFDDSTTLMTIDHGKLKISHDNGLNWDVLDQLGRRVSRVEVDRNYPKSRAFAVDAEGKVVYKTDDKGQHWEKLNFDSPIVGDENDAPLSMTAYFETNPLSDGDILVHVAGCDIVDGNFLHCSSSKRVFVSSNGKDFSLVESLKAESEEKDGEEVFSVFCRFDGFKPEDSEAGDAHGIVCEVDSMETKDSETVRSSKVFQSSDYGKTLQIPHGFEDLNIVSLIHVGDYNVITTVEDKYNPDSASQLWISRDGLNYEKAVIPTRTGRYTFVLKFGSSSKELALQNNAFTDSGEKTPSVLISTSNGTKFTPLTEAAAVGYYSLSGVGNQEGVVAYTVSTPNYSDESKESPDKAKISFDNGKTWSNLRIDDPDHEFDCDTSDPENCYLRPLWFLEDWRNSHVTTTPGISACVAEVIGDSGKPSSFENVKTFITGNGGYSWHKILDFPASVVFGDYGNIILAVPFSPDNDGDPAAEFYYSLDQGNTWSEYQFKEPLYFINFVPTALDGSGATFILQAATPTGRDDGRFLTVDFSDAFDGNKCTDSDMGEWYTNGGGCVSGSKHKFRRRKEDAKCLVKELFKDLEPTEETCDCTKSDYECSPEFSLNKDGECVLDRNLLEISGTCGGENKDRKIKLLPMVLERGNKCRAPLKIDTIEIDCGAYFEGGEPSPIKIEEHTLDFGLKSYQYFDTIADETLLLGSDNHEVYISYDSGQTTQKLDFQDKIIEVVFNQYFNTSAYLFGSSNKLYVTHDRARSFKEYKLPDAKQLGFPLTFHAKDVDTFIFYGAKDCDSLFSPNCHAVAYITKDGGKRFRELTQGALRCEFIGSINDDSADPDMIMCLVKDKGANERHVVTSSNFFENQKTVFENAIGFISAGEYTIIAVPHDNDELRAYVTVDGREFAEASLPAELNIDKQQAYTVLGSQEGAIFFHLTTEMKQGSEYGALMKSNSNGTSFVVLERAVNRGSSGFVDFEKALGLEGIIMINTVSNAEEVSSGSGVQKKLKSKISFNDGADWIYLSPPERDSEGKKYQCDSKSLSSCSLNLHGYTERKDERDTYSSGSALGYMIGVGNVGEYLLPKEECSTFITTDGGFTWKEIKKGSYQWEFGDRGSVIVLVKDQQKTDLITYSVDSGKTWNDYKFAGEELYVEDIITTPQDSAMRFLLIGKSSSISGKDTKTFTVDFTQSFDRQCQLDRDYQYRVFGDCLFGHQAEYLQKVNDNCYNGAAPLEGMKKIVKNCSCTRSDFECDYNYYKANDGTCKLVKGLEPADPSQICKKDSDLIEYFEITGYRKIPLSTCEGGLRLDVASKSHACPGKEKEFKNKYGVSGRHILYIMIAPVLIFIGAAWFVYERGIKRNGGLSRFGEIRLGDDDLVEENFTDRVVNSVVRVGVFGFSALAASKQLVQRNAVNAWQRLKLRIQGGRGGPSYSSLTHEQLLDEADELLAGHDEDANDLASFIDSEGDYDIGAEELPQTHSPAPYTDHEPSDHETSSHETADHNNENGGNSNEV
ncbi:type I sorting receptor [Lachancea thermotolerans CBS 6340]|uniref:KLTH0H08294p n=1 Tax=Lachancea thermotolerans (strain ATCC 56472 / CBS 6340 / NRRL Y-8284) TaxID=559295 RepID=C5E2W7_LACTC|nr:KLTH0H08294p [Lachancea thermotolerans CBS 6340]CAR30378.1 KLTH0H08294p [Lachancea thermotolerans CBS 6340]